MMKLIELWKNKAEYNIEGLVFSENGNVGASSWDECAYIFDSDGNLLNKICGRKDMEDASYCCGKFGFINFDGHAYITDENGNLIKKIKVGNDYHAAITMTEDGFVACSRRCAFFDFNGNKLWDIVVDWVDNGPSRYQGYWYVADTEWRKLFIVKDGRIVNEINYNEGAYDTAVCGEYLAVTTMSHLYLYDISDPKNPREIWRVNNLLGFARECSLPNGFLRVRFSPDCRYIVVADTGNHKLKIFDIEGNLVLEKEYNQYGNLRDEVWSVAWWNDQIAVGIRSGEIYVYKIEGYEITTPITKLFAPYHKLKQLYQQVSNSNDYKALLLKGPFHRNVIYFDNVSSFIKTLNRLKQFRSHLSMVTHEIERLHKEESNSSNVLKIIDLIQEAKIDIFLMKTILNRADELEENIAKNKPSTSCPEDSLKVIEDIVKTNDTRKILSYWSTENSSLDDVIKCSISQIIDELSKNYETFKSELLRDLVQKEEKLGELEKILKD